MLTSASTRHSLGRSLVHLPLAARGSQGAVDSLCQDRGASRGVGEGRGGEGRGKGGEREGRRGEGKEKEGWGGSEGGITSTYS